jgi:hypothetical protein
VGFDASRCRHRVECLFELRPIVHWNIEKLCARNSRRIFTRKGKLAKKLGGKLLKEKARHANRWVLLIPFARNVFE